MLLVDAHVHIHPCFDRAAFLHAMSANFSANARAMGVTAPRFVACLTESAGVHGFDDLINTPVPDWKVRATDDDCALILDHPELDSVAVVAGRQIVTSERLEVLALGLREEIPDGNPILEVVGRVQNAGALAVLPWGFGKWIGRRGRVVTDLLERFSPADILLGDNSGRLGWWTEPQHLKQGRTRGFKVLPGTDPFPFARETQRAGRYGFMLDGKVDGGRPWQSLRDRVGRARPSDLVAFGQLEQTWRFVRNQIAMQMR